MMREYLEDRRKGNGKEQRLRNKSFSSVTNGQKSASKILFTALIGSKFSDRICSENGADGKIIESETLRRINAAGVELVVETLRLPLVFDKVAENANGVSSKLTCTISVSIETELHTRHGYTIREHNLKLLVTEQRLADPLEGRPILEALGLNTRDLPTAAADQFCGIFYADLLLESITDTGDGRI